jgi:hypothetical protein
VSNTKQTSADTRFLSVMVSGEVFAYAADESWQQAQDEADEWVWQSAPDRETAIARHEAAFDAWQKSAQ